MFLSNSIDPGEVSVPSREANSIISHSVVKLYEQVYVFQACTAQLAQQPLPLFTIVRRMFHHGYRILAPSLCIHQPH